MRRDPHRVLGVPPGATPEQLHDAYRRLVMQHHPDRNGGTAEATERFQEIQEAYDELRNRPTAARPVAWDSVTPRGTIWLQTIYVRVENRSSKKPHLNRSKTHG